METSKLDRLDLVVIHPGSAGVYNDLPDYLVAVEPPLWARLITGYVQDHGFSVKIIDAEANRLAPDQVAAMVVTDHPRLVCIAAYGHQPSASTQSMAAAGAIAKAVRRYSEVPIIMVGGHVSALPAQTMREEVVDFACVGEGPATVVGLLRGDHLDDVRGLVWRRPNGTIVTNPRADLLRPEDLHGNVWRLLPMHKYRAHNWHGFGSPSGRHPYASVYTTLGCPYRCTFCCINAPFGGNGYRMREPGTVVAEMAMLYREYGVKTFKIVDEMFILNERHYTAICQGLIDRGIGQYLNIWAYARVDTVNPEKLDLLHRAGFRWLALGIESGSALVRDGAKKALKTEDIEGTVRAIQAAGINIIANYIFGLPDDDLESMEGTKALAMRLNTEYANFYCAMAYPGSALYDQAVKAGWTLPDTWLGYSQHSYECRPLDTAHVGAAEVLEVRDRAFRMYFTRIPYVKMVAEKFGAGYADEVLHMAGHSLRRRLLEAPIGQAAGM